MRSRRSRLVTFLVLLLASTLPLRTLAATGMPCCPALGSLAMLAVPAAAAMPAMAHAMHNDHATMEEAVAGGAATNGGVAFADAPGAPTDASSPSRPESHRPLDCCAAVMITAAPDATPAWCARPPPAPVAPPNAVTPFLTGAPLRPPAPSFARSA